MSKKIDYKKSGVDIHKADTFVERIKKLVPTTFNDQVLQGIGGFAAVYKLNEERYLASCADGVGTKLKLAQQIDKHYGIGIDLVAMCVNDLLCVGARPLFFLDYMAFGKLDTRVSEELIAGMVDGCRQSGMALIGGETAEMPGLYETGEYDLAGFSVGELAPQDLFSEQKINEGDILIGLASTGFHSNGYSLLRKLVQDHETERIEQLLVPTQIYVSVFNKINRAQPGAILAAAHMTGGGLQNIPRISDKFDYEINYWPSFDEMAPVFKTILERVDLPRQELFTTFNMGVGMILLVKQDKANEIFTLLEITNFKAWKLGQIRKGTGEISFNAWS
jgi:phosphoribosylformylglycinamidine cyclo-ligase